MATKDFKRKLSAIFSADVAGYSRLMGEDEAATVEALPEPLYVTNTLSPFVRVMTTKSESSIAPFFTGADS
jgi:adenylate cyclase